MLNPTECTIGLDVGTTTAKVIAFDAQGGEVARASAAVTLYHETPGMAEQDPAEVYAAVSQALGQVARDAVARGYTVTAVGFSAAMHSLIALDAQGVPLTRALTWMDTRAKNEAETLWNSPEGKAIYARTGTPIHPMAPLPKLLWLRRAHPDIFARAARFVSLKEWIWHQWFGEWVIDASIASATGLYNLREGTWDAGALALLDLSPQRLSTIVPTTYTKTGTSGAYFAQAGIPARAIFSVGASDGVLANLGVGAIGSERMVITIGTSCAVRIGSTEPFTDPATRSFCYVLAPGRFILGGPSNSGGIVIDWLFHDVMRGQRTQGTLTAVGQDDFQALMTAAGEAQASGLICLPYVAGERAPLWSADAHAAYLGLTLQHTAADVMRATVEGIILNAYWIASGLFGARGSPTEVVASGKVLEPAWIRQLTADTFGIPVGYNGESDASAVGSAMLAQIAAGTRTWEQLSFTGVVGGNGGQGSTLPRDTAGAQQRFQRFKRAVAVLQADLPEVEEGS